MPFFALCSDFFADSPCGSNGKKGKKGTSEAKEEATLIGLARRRWEGWGAEKEEEG